MKLVNPWAKPQSGSIIDALAIFELDLIPDMFPDEVIWTLQDPNGDGVASGVGSLFAASSGPSQGEQFQPFSPVYLSVPGTYKFVIWDRNEDGLCCGFGSGKYSIRLNGEIIYTSNGRYGSKDTFSFEIKSDTEPKQYTLLPDTLYGKVSVNINVREGAQENVWALISPDDLIYWAGHMNSQTNIDIFKCGTFKIVLLDSRGDGLSNNDRFVVTLDGKEVANGNSFFDVKRTTFDVPCSQSSSSTSEDPIQLEFNTENQCKRTGEVCRRSRRECCSGLRCLRSRLPGGAWTRTLRCV